MVAKFLGNSKWQGILCLTGFIQVLILFIACFSLFHSSVGEKLSATELRYRVLFYKC